MSQRVILPSTGTAVQTLLDLLVWQAGVNGARPAYTFRGEDESERSLTYAQLATRARAIATAIRQSAACGDRVLLVYPAGLDFIAAFFGCVAAGALAVPATYPKPKRPLPRLSAIASDCQATVALTTAQTLSTLELARAAPELARVRWITTDTVPDEAAADWQPPDITSDDLVFLQYTSGSTSAPKGVMISHANLFANLEMIRRGFGLPAATAGGDGPGNGVFWLPAYHDMGLIGGILSALYTGGHSVLLSPTTFLQSPWRWLKAITDYRAIVSGAPNFGYDLCVRKVTAEQSAQLDLSSWRVAFCGAEPIRADSLQSFVQTFARCGFSPKAFYPCYGLAEATLLAAGGDGPGPLTVAAFDRKALAEHRVVAAAAPLRREHVQELVGCGHALLDEQIAIVDPQTLCETRSGQVGEIWLKGSNVARGYWQRDDENHEIYAAHIAGTGAGPFVRTGDLGFIRNGHLFVTGRLKDVIIVRGRNHYPQDMELTALKAHAAVDAGGAAAFALGEVGQERLVIVVEVDRQFRKGHLQDVIRKIRRDVTEEHEIELHAVALIRQASLPRTTSGKVQRALCRDRYLGGTLKIVAEWRRDEHGQLHIHSQSAGRVNGHVKESGHGVNGNGGVGQSAAKPVQRPPKPLQLAHYSDRDLERLTDKIERFILALLAARGGMAAGELDRQRPFAEYALDSYAAVEISQELSDWLDVRLAAVVAWNYPTPMALASYLARRYAGLEPDDTSSQETVAMGGVAVNGNGAARPAGSAGADRDLERLLAEIEGLDEEEVETALANRSSRE